MARPALLALALVPVLGLGACAPCHAPEAPAQPALIPLADFLEHADQPEVPSPSGQRVARLMPSEGPPPRRLNVFVREGAQGRPRQVTQVRDRDLADLQWFSDTRIGYRLAPRADENFRLRGGPRRGQRAGADARGPGGRRRTRPTGSGFPCCWPTAAGTPGCPGGNRTSWPRRSGPAPLRLVP